VLNDLLPEAMTLSERNGGLSTFILRAPLENGLPHVTRNPPFYIGEHHQQACSRS